MKAKTKAENLMVAASMLVTAHGAHIKDIAATLGVDYSSAFRYVKELGATKTDTQGVYHLKPTNEMVKFAAAILASVANS